MSIHCAIGSDGTCVKQGAPAPKPLQWRALTEIEVGRCDGMTYEEIHRSFPKDWEERGRDKLRYVVVDHYDDDGVRVGRCVGACMLTARGVGLSFHCCDDFGKGLSAEAECCTM